MKKINGLMCLCLMIGMTESRAMEQGKLNAKVEPRVNSLTIERPSSAEGLLRKDSLVAPKAPLVQHGPSWPTAVIPNIVVTSPDFPAKVQSDQASRVVEKK